MATVADAAAQHHAALNYTRRLLLIDREVNTACRILTEADDPDFVTRCRKFEDRAAYALSFAKLLISPSQVSHIHEAQ